MRDMTKHPVTQKEVLDTLDTLLQKSLDDSGVETIDSYILQKLIDWNKDTDQDSIDVVFNYAE